MVLQKKITKVITFAFAISIGTSCVSVNKSFKCPEINKDNVQIEINNNLFEIADSTAYVKLETNRNCLIGNVIDMQCVDNKLFILSGIDDNKEILVFNLKGKFLNKIGKIGNGPGEYVSVSSIGINQFSNYIILLDPLKEKIHKYDYKGNHICSISVQNECSYIRKMSYVSKTKIRSVSLINSSSAPLISESDENMSNMEALWEANYKVNGGFEYANIPISSNGLFFILPFSYTIYDYSNNQLTPKVRLNIQNKYTPIEEVEMTDDITDISVSAIKKGYNPINSIANSNKYLLVRQLNGNSVLWDLEKKSGKYFDYLSYVPFNIKIKNTNLSKVIEFEKGFIGLIPTNQLLNVKKQYQDLNIVSDERLKKVYNNTSIEDNPTICIYFIK